MARGLALPLPHCRDRTDRDTVIDLRRTLPSAAIGLAAVAKAGLMPWQARSD